MKAAAKELGQPDVFSALEWHSPDGFDVNAFSHSSALAKELPRNEKPWHIAAYINESDATAANKLALYALNHGAESTWFTKPFQGASALVATAGIERQIAPVWLQGADLCDAFYSNARARDGIIVNSARYRDSGCSAVQEVAFALAQAAEANEARQFSGTTVFYTASGTAFLTEVAKLRALQLLWTGLINSREAGSQPFQIIAEALATHHASTDIETNYVRFCASFMAAAAGGATAIVDRPWNNDHRLVRNILLILKHEAKTHWCQNPTEGSYFIDQSVYAIAHKAWALAKEIMNSGGFSSYAQSGRLKAAIEQHRSDQIAAFQSKRLRVVGMNVYATQPQPTLDLTPEDSRLPAPLRLANTPLP